jgi:hypothetical protein
MSDHEQGDVSLGAPADPYDIGAGAEIGQDADTDNDELTDAFERLAATSGALANTDVAGPSNAYEAASSNAGPLNADGAVDGVTDGPEMSYQNDPLSDSHGGPWNRALDGGVGGPQPDQSGLPAPQPHPGGLGGPQPDHDGDDPLGSGHLDNSGAFDLN